MQTGLGPASPRAPCSTPPKTGALNHGHKKTAKLGAVCPPSFRAAKPGDRYRDRRISLPESAPNVNYLCSIVDQSTGNDTRLTVIISGLKVSRWIEQRTSRARGIPMAGARVAFRSSLKCTK